MTKNYYIIGTKYGGHDDKYPEMLEIGAVSVGFSRQIDLSDWYGASEKSIIEYLRSLGQDEDFISQFETVSEYQAGRPHCYQA